MTTGDTCSDSPYLRQLEAHVPAVFSEYRGENGARTLGSLSDGLIGFTPPPTIQGRDDLIDLAGKEAAALLGPETARALRDSLEESFSALTANHHAINTLPDFTQGILVYGLRLLSGEREKSGGALPVFAAGGVPMSDFTCPCGVLLGRPRHAETTAGMRCRLFKPRARKSLVSLHPAFTAEDVSRAWQRLPDGKWLRHERKALGVLFNGILAAPEVLQQRLYAHQCTVINAKLWPRLFKPGVAVPRLVMLDKVALERELLLADIENENSLAHVLLFSPELRAAVVRALEGERGCWTRKDREDRSEPVRGSMFFWGVDRQDRMVPLGLDQENNRLFSAQYPAFSLELTPGAIKRALKESRILPGLYLGFAAIALARGLMCCGGVFQTGYLRRMRNGTAASLAATGFADMAARLEGLPDAPLTSGFLPLGFANGSTPPHAAGSLEIFAAGGLSGENLEILRSVTVARALESSFDYIYDLATPPRERLPGWAQALRGAYAVELSPAADSCADPRLASAPVVR